jgi:hypothetical protein
MQWTDRRPLARRWATSGQLVLFAILSFSAAVWGRERSRPKPRPSPAVVVDDSDLATGPETKVDLSGLPRWTEGMTWTVKSVYQRRTGESGRPDDGVPIWSEPVYWQYRVKHVKAGRAATNYLIHVRNKDTTHPSAASLVFTRYSVQPNTPDVLALVQGRFLTVVGDRSPSVTKAFTKPPAPPHPCLIDDALIPCDFPALPFLPMPPEGQKREQLTRSFQVSAVAGGVKFSRDLVQTEFQNKSLEAFADKDVADFIRSKSWFSKDLNLVELRRKFDGSHVKQVWSPNLPWFLYSESATSRSCLWDVQAASAVSGEPKAAPSDMSRRPRTTPASIAPQD